MPRTLVTLQGLWGHLYALLFLPGSTFSVASLACALVVAAASLAWTRLRRRRAVRARGLVRMLFPRRLIRSPSSRADFWMALFNTLPAVVLFGWMVASSIQISGAVAGLLVRGLGAPRHTTLDAAACRTIATVAMFLAYDLGIWLDHYLSHKVPFLWEFHKVHHTAEVLSPLTVFRVHPVDSLIRANVTAAVVGLTGGVLQYLFGAAGSAFVLSGANVILVVFVFATIHLQHSHIWISFRAAPGRVFISPAHHQVHHSANPIHFNRNFGNCLAIWDWAFGTLHVPHREREVLTFGAELRPGAPSAHSVTGTLLSPFADAGRLISSALRPQGWVGVEAGSQRPERKTLRGRRFPAPSNAAVCAKRPGFAEELEWRAPHGPDLNRSAAVVEAAEIAHAAPLAPS